MIIHSVTDDSLCFFFSSYFDLPAFLFAISQEACTCHLNYDLHHEQTTREGSYFLAVLVGCQLLFEERENFTGVI